MSAIQRIGSYFLLCCSVFCMPSNRHIINLSSHMVLQLSTKHHSISYLCTNDFLLLCCFFLISFCFFNALSLSLVFPLSPSLSFLYIHLLVHLPEKAHISVTECSECNWGIVLGPRRSRRPSESFFLSNRK